MSVLSAVLAGACAARPKIDEGTGMDTIADDDLEVTLGIDTHLDQHAAAVLTGSAAWWPRPALRPRRTATSSC